MKGVGGGEGGMHSTHWNVVVVSSSFSQSDWRVSMLVIFLENDFL